MGYKKRILFITAILSVTVIAGTFAIWGSNFKKRQIRFDRQEVSADKKVKKLYPSAAEARKLSEQILLVCTPVAECYQRAAGEQGLPCRLLAELQEYVRRGDTAAAITVYRDESLLMDVEELHRLCPDYEELIAQEIESGRLSWNEADTEQDILGGIRQIYALELDGQEGAELLIWQSNLTVYGNCPWILLVKTEDGYLVGETTEVGNFLYGGAEESEIAVFTWGEGEEKACYLMQEREQGALWLENLVLCGDYKEEIEKSSRGARLFEGGGRYISRETTVAQPYFFYVNSRAVLTPDVKKYITDNVELFAHKLFSYAFGNERVIWGDEELATVTEEEKAQIEEALTVYYRDIRGDSPDTYDYDIYYFMKYMVRADYDNDGEAELFFRTKDEQNIMLVQDQEGYRLQHVNLYGEDEQPASQMWFVEWQGKTVTFEIALPFGEAYPVLSAYLIEGGQKTPLITCQLVFGETVEIATYIKDFDFKDCLKLSLLQEAEGGESCSFYEAAEIKAAVREQCSLLQVAFDETESFLPQAFLAFIREGGREILCGKNLWGYLEPYRIDTREDSHAYCAREDFNRHYYHSILNWAYRWEARDGSENFLVCELHDGYDGWIWGAQELNWLRDDGDGMHWEAEMLLFSEYDSTYVISYEGRKYCIAADTSMGVTGGSGIYVIALGEAGEWEGCHILLTPKTDAYEIDALGGASAPAAVSEYVAAEYEDMLSACREGRIYTGRADGRLLDAPWRDIKNRDAYYSDEGLEWGKPCDYRAVDADNDGELEYLAVYYEYYPYAYRGAYYPNSSVKYIMYGYREGKLVELSLDTVEKESALADYYGMYAWELGDDCAVEVYLQQLWFEEIDGVTYLFTLELLAPTHSFLLRARIIEEGAVKEAGAWLLSAPVVEGRCME